MITENEETCLSELDDESGKSEEDESIKIVDNSLSN